MVYLPKHFVEDRPEALARLIGQHGFATLVTNGPDGLVASHVPLLYDRDRGPHGALTGHLARANPQVRDLAAGCEALAIFHGPHAYVSPRWYATHPSVPTWNYVTVHAYGSPRLIEGPVELAQLVATLSETYEAGQEAPWRYADLPDSYARAMLRAIVGFEIAVRKLEGKFKLSQNRDATDRANVIAALRREGGPDGAAVAALMTERESSSSG